MEKAVVVFSGGLDSACACALLKPKYSLYGVTFSYGQRARREVARAKKLARILGIKEHKTVDIGFMADLYGQSNVLTDPDRAMPRKFQYSIVVPVRNAVFLSIASAWAYTIRASLVAYGAHTGDVHYPDCRPDFSDQLQAALNLGETDGIKSGKRKKIKIWSPFTEGLSKGDLLRAGLKTLGDHTFDAWSCYENGRLQCGKCESCNNRRTAFAEAGITDKTRYA